MLISRSWRGMSVGPDLFAFAPWFLANCIMGGIAAWILGAAEADERDAAHVRAGLATELAEADLRRTLDAVRSVTDMLAARRLASGRLELRSEEEGRTFLASYRAPDALGVVIAAFVDAEETVAGLRTTRLAVTIVLAVAMTCGLAGAMLLARRCAAGRGQARAFPFDPLTGRRTRPAPAADSRRAMTAQHAKGASVAVVLVGTAGREEHVRDAIETVLLPNLRSADVACRWDAGQILIIIKGCSLVTASIRAEALRATVAKARLGNPAATACFGIAGTNADNDLSAVIRRAGIALDEAVRMGGSRIVLATGKDKLVVPFPTPFHAEASPATAPTRPSTIIAAVAAT